MIFVFCVALILSTFIRFMVKDKTAKTLWTVVAAGIAAMIFFSLLYL